MAEVISAKDIYGFGIYHDKLKRTVYSGPFMKDGYVISDKNANKFRYYRMRPMGAFIALVAGAMAFDNNFLVGSIIGVVFYIVTTIMFHFLFLPKCPMIRNYAKPKQNLIVNLANSQSIKGAVISVVLITILSALLIFIARSSMTGYDYFFSHVVAFAAMIFAYINVLAIRYKLKNRTLDVGEHLSEEEIRERKRIKKVNDL